MKPGDLVRIIARDGECTGHGMYICDEDYPILSRSCPLIFYRDKLAERWTFGHFDPPWWALEVISEAK
jgi:hypothetical protein